MPPVAGAGREHVERLERHRPVGVRVVVRVDLVDVGLALAPVQRVDVVLHGVVHVDRVLVDEHLGAEQVDLAEDPRPVRRGVDDHDVLRRGRPQRHLRGGEVLRAPVPAAVVRLADRARLAEEREQVVRRPGPEPLAGLERQLERRGADVGEQHVEVVRVEPRLLRLAAEHELRVVDDVLVDGGGRGDEDRDADVAPPAGPAHLLPRARDRARDSRRAPPRRDGRCPRPARARWCSRRRAPRRRAARARSPGARSAGSRPGSRGPATAARGPCAASRAGSRA